MRVLFVSNLFPNPHEPTRGIFNLHQVRHLSKHCEVRVVAPIPWLPFRRRVPLAERIGGLQVEHPKQFYLPKIGRTLNPFLYALSVRHPLKRLQPYDVLLVNWAYPDACGVARVATELRSPFVVSISGSDANRYLDYRIRRRQILAMLRQARAVITRSRALKELLVAHGAEGSNIQVLYNGVDRSLFDPSRLNPEPLPPRVVYIGRLSPEKGVADMLSAVSQLDPPPPVLVIGDGPQGIALRRLAQNARVTWLGARLQEEIAALLHSTDIVCLPSHMEGVPNAALEAFACGLPVVATRVGGLPEVITPQTGVLAEPRNPASLAAALREALCRRWDREAILAHAARFDWETNAAQLAEILRNACQR